MNIVVIKFEQGWRLVRNHKRIEAWKNDRLLNTFPTWMEAIAFMDRLEDEPVKAEQHQTMQ
jgi:hypothetical protein